MLLLLCSYILSSFSSKCLNLCFFCYFVRPWVYLGKSTRRRTWKPRPAAARGPYVMPLRWLPWQLRADSTRITLCWGSTTTTTARPTTRTTRSWIERAGIAPSCDSLATSGDDDVLLTESGNDGRKTKMMFCLWTHPVIDLRESWDCRGSWWSSKF